MSQGRQPTELIAALIAHKTITGKDPELIMLRDTYLSLHKFFFRGRLHTLCCGKGMLFNGIPTITTSSPMCETFLICY